MYVRVCWGVQCEVEVGLCNRRLLPRPREELLPTQGPCREILGEPAYFGRKERDRKGGDEAAGHDGNKVDC